MARRKSDKETLIVIDKPIKDEKGNSNAAEVAQKIWDMYDEEYNLTIKEICNILLCDRQWVVKNVLDNVKHIFLNEKIRVFLIRYRLNNYSDSIYLKDYYYLSRIDFYRWLNENTVKTRQTIMVDLIDYSKDKEAFRENIKKYSENIANIMKKKSGIPQSLLLKQEKIEFEGRLIELLTKRGKKIFNPVDVTSRKVPEIEVTNVEVLPEEFTSIKEMKNDIGKSLEIVYRSLYKYGAIKYTIAGSLVRYDKNYIINSMPSTNEYVITTAYENLIDI